MHTPNKSSKTRLKMALILSIILVIALLFRLAYLQIYISEDLKKRRFGTMDKINRYKSKKRDNLR